MRREYQYGMDPAQVNSYISRISSTIVTLLKIPEGVVAAFVLYYLFLFIGTLGGGFADAFPRLISFFREQVGGAVAVPALNEALTALAAETIAVPAFLFAGMIAVVVFSAGMALIEVIALILLRFFHKGAAVLRVIYWIRFAISCISLACTIYVLYLIASGAGAVAKTVLFRPVDTLLPVFLAGLPAIIAQILVICYQKDIAMAMGTVAYETETGRVGRFRRTHLSGISFLFALFCLILPLSTLIYMFRFEKEITGGAGLFSSAAVPLWITIGFLLVPVIKYFSVSFCYRNLKLARKEKVQYRGRYED